jgi:hypothetical protein
MKTGIPWHNLYGPQGLSKLKKGVKMHFLWGKNAFFVFYPFFESDSLMTI